MLQFNLRISFVVINWGLKSDYLNALRLTWCFKLILWTRTTEITDFDLVSLEIDSRKLFLNLILLAWLKRFGIGILDSKIWYADELDFWSKVI